MKKYLKLVFVFSFIIVPLFGKAEQSIKFNELYNVLDKEWANGIKEGKALDFAYTAESNGYPNPQIVLKWQSILQISSYQKRLISSLHSNTLGYALTLGTELIQLETNLQLGFIDKSISKETIRSLVYRIEKIKAELRVMHLLAHKQINEILEPQQIDLYYVLKTEFIKNQKLYMSATTENKKNEEATMEPNQTRFSTQEIDMKMMIDTEDTSKQIKY